MLGNKGSKQFYRTGGTRGGQSQFKWEDVKSDKDRENYLGHSLQAPVGRWQKGKDLTWYAKAKEEEKASVEEERRRIRDLDEDLLNAALGIQAEKKWKVQASIDKEDLKQLLARGSVERIAGEEIESERIKGLGAATSKFHDHIERKTTLEKELERAKSGKVDEINTEQTSSRILSIGNNAQDDIVDKKGRKRKADGDDSDNDSSSSDSSDSHRKKKHKKSKKHKSHKKHKKHHKHKSSKD